MGQNHRLYSEQLCAECLVLSDIYRSGFSAWAFTSNLTAML